MLALQTVVVLNPRDALQVSDLDQSELDPNPAATSQQNDVEELLAVLETEEEEEENRAPGNEGP